MHTYRVMMDWLENFDYDNNDVQISVLRIRPTFITNNFY